MATDKTGQSKAKKAESEDEGREPDYDDPRTDQRHRIRSLPAPDSGGGQRRSPRRAGNRYRGR